MSSFRRAVVVVLAIGLLGAASLFPITVSAQKIGVRVVPAVGPVPAKPAGESEAPKDAEFSEGLTLPTDRKLKKSIEAADDFISEENWDAAAEHLQALLNAPEDLFVEVRRKGPNGKETSSWISIRQEANRLLGTVPAQGLEVYELKFGGRAKARLAEGKKQSDPKIIAEVAQRYLHTEAGAEASNLLGTYYLDRGDFVAAALSFERLLQHKNAGNLPPLTLFKAALAFRRAGDNANADKAWKLLVQKTPRDGLRLGEQMATLEDLRSFLDKAGPSDMTASSFDFPLYRGNASRSAQGVGGAPYLDDKRWEQPAIYKREGATEHTKSWLTTAVGQREGRQEPVLPTFFPIAATVQTEKGPLHLLVFRSYWGVHAVNLTNGKLEWDSQTDGSLDRIVGDRDHPQKLQVLNQWYPMYQNTSTLHVLYENSTLGTLSTDGSRVYGVDDLALPPHPQYLQQFAWGGQPMFGVLKEAVLASRLLAWDLENGKLLWELGGVETGEKEDPLSNSYFLGPPLPVGGKLYVLNEKRGELRLLCLDPLKKGALSWSQTLANVKEQLLQDVGRRIQAANLSYGEGILVCPTNTGAVIGVDLLSHSLVWAYSYRPGLPGTDSTRMTNRLGMYGQFQVANPEWKISAPVIHEGKVVFTAPDGGGVYCLNLRTGKEIWHAARSDDLYLAGVFNGKVLLVGRNTCRALSLSEGRQVWRKETGLPSGQGVASKNIYYLPLKDDPQYHAPAVCAIDIEHGNVLGYSKRRPSRGGAGDSDKLEVPGNLLFFEGDVVSQGLETVTAYPQLEVKEAEVTVRLQKNPNDPAWLTERGEMRLSKGNLQGAVDDLRAALVNKPPADTLPKTRAKLFEALTELFKLDFNKMEKSLPEYEELCHVPVPPDATAQEKLKLQEEQERRQGHYLALLAKGREDQGRLVEAFDIYMKFAGLSGKQELVTSVDEQNVKIKPRVWAQGQIAAMIARASPEQRRPLELKISEHWKAVEKEGDLEAWRHFVEVFGSLCKVGQEAHLHLAERLIQENQENALLEAELHLLQVRQQEDRQVAGRAVEDLARLMMRRAQTEPLLMEDAAYYYRILDRDFDHTVIRDGKTGADLFNDLATDKRFLPHLDEPLPAWTGGKMKAKELHGNFGQQFQTFYFEPEGELIPFFHRHRVAVNLNTAQLKLVDVLANSDRWTRQIMNMNLWYLNSGWNVRFPFHVQGHLVVCNVGHMVYALDPTAKPVKILWERNLLGSGGISPQVNPQFVPDRDGGLEVIYPDGVRMKVGRTGAVEASYVCLQTRTGLEAVDPLTGTKLWTRQDVRPNAHLFGDERHVYVVDVRTDGSGTITGTKALRARDGVSVDVPDFSQLYQRRLRIIGCNLLLADNEAQGTVLRLYDVHTGKDRWRKTFSPKALVLRSEEPNLAGVVEPNDGGKVKVFDLRTQKEVLRAVVDPKDLEKVPENGVHLLQDSDHFYLVINSNAQPNNLNPWAGPGPWSNLSPGMRTLPVHGQIYAFDRRTGKLRWKADMLNEMLVLEHFKDMPILLFSSRYMPANAGGFRGGQWVTRTESIDKRTGKRLYRSNETPWNGQQQFIALNVNPKAGTIDLVGYQMKLQHYLDKNESGTTGDGGRGSSKERSSVLPADGRPVFKDRVIIQSK